MRWSLVVGARSLVTDWSLGRDAGGGQWGIDNLWMAPFLPDNIPLTSGMVSWDKSGQATFMTSVMPFSGVFSAIYTPPILQSGGLKLESIMAGSSGDTDTKIAMRHYVDDGDTIEIVELRIASMLGASPATKGRHATLHVFTEPQLRRLLTSLEYGLRSRAELATAVDTAAVTADVVVTVDPYPAAEVSWRVPLYDKTFGQDSLSVSYEASTPGYRYFIIVIPQLPPQFEPLSETITEVIAVKGALNIFVTRPDGSNNYLPYGMRGNEYILHGYGIMVTISLLVLILWRYLLDFYFISTRAIVQLCLPKTREILSDNFSSREETVDARLMEDLRSDDCNNIDAENDKTWTYANGPYYGVGPFPRRRVVCHFWCVAILLCRLASTELDGLNMKVVATKGYLSGVAWWSPRLLGWTEGCCFIALVVSVALTDSQGHLQLQIRQARTLIHLVLFFATVTLLQNISGLEWLVGYILEVIIYASVYVLSNFRAMAALSQLSSLSLDDYRTVDEYSELDFQENFRKFLLASVMRTSVISTLQSFSLPFSAFDWYRLQTTSKLLRNSKVLNSLTKARSWDSEAAMAGAECFPSPIILLFDNLYLIGLLFFITWLAERARAVPASPEFLTAGMEWRKRQLTTKLPLEIYITANHTDSDPSMVVVQKSSISRNF